jgi:hypothetical protein
MRSASIDYHKCGAGWMLAMPGRAAGVGAGDGEEGERVRHFGKDIRSF